MIKKDMWTISLEDSSVCFAYGYEEAPMFQGNFRYFSGMVLADKNFKALDLMLYVESETIKEADSRRNPMLLSADYFNGAAYPVLIFHSGHSKPSKDPRTINVDLTLKGQARPVCIEILNIEYTPHPSEDRALMIASVVISAADFNLGIRESHDPDNELTFTLQLFLRKPFISKN